MQTFNQLFFKKKQIFSYFFKEISEDEAAGCRGRYIKNISASRRLCFPASLESIRDITVGPNSNFNY